MPAMRLLNDNRMVMVGYGEVKGSGDAGGGCWGSKIGRGDADPVGAAWNGALLWSRSAWIDADNRGARHTDSGSEQGRCSRQVARVGSGWDA